MALRLDPLNCYFREMLTRKDCTQLGPATWRKEWERCGTDLDRTIVVVNDSADFDEYIVAVAYRRDINHFHKDREFIDPIPTIICRPIIGLGEPEGTTSGFNGDRFLCELSAHLADFPAPTPAQISPALSRRRENVWRDCGRERIRWLIRLRVA
jgi:hypothetical protein